MRTSIRNGFKMGLLVGVCACAGAVGMVAAGQAGNQGQPLDRTRPGMTGGETKITQSQDGKTVYLWRVDQTSSRIEFVTSAEADENQMNRTPGRMGTDRNQDRDTTRNPTRLPN